MFIDIFPLYGHVEGKIAETIQYIRLRAYRYANLGRKMTLKYDYEHRKKTAYFKDPHVIVWKIFSIFMSHHRLCERYIHICEQGDRAYSQNVSLVSFLPYDSRYIWPREWFSEIEYLPFEDREVPCAKAYDRILRKQFGDYMKFVKGAAKHTLEIFDADTPYTEYLKKHG